MRSDGARDVVAVTGAVLRGYPVPEHDHVHAVRILGSTINGFLALERIGGFDHSDPSPEESWARTVAAFDTLPEKWQ